MGRKGENRDINRLQVREREGRGWERNGGEVKEGEGR